MTLRPDTTTSAAPQPAEPCVPAEHGLVGPDGRPLERVQPAPEAPGRRRQLLARAVRVVRRLGRWLAAAAVLTLIGIVVAAAVAVHTTAVARSAAIRAAVCAAAYDDRRDAREHRQHVPADVVTRIRRCEREADEHAVH